jgi:hypothetical protein
MILSLVELHLAWLERAKKAKVLHEATRQELTGQAKAGQMKITA